VLKTKAFWYEILCQTADILLPAPTPLKTWLHEKMNFTDDTTVLWTKETYEADLGTATQTVSETGTPFTLIQNIFTDTTGTDLTADAYRQTNYINDTNCENTRVLMEYTTDGTMGTSTTAYTYGLQRETYTMTTALNGVGNAIPGMTTENSGTYYYTGTGSVSNLINNTGSTSYTYTPDGIKTAYAMNAPGGTDIQGKETLSQTVKTYENYDYNGEYTHTSLGIQYLRARYYKMATGTFTSKDTYAGTLTDILSQNRYTYAENNPVTYADPSGHAVKARTGAIASTLKNTKTFLANTAKKKNQAKLSSLADNIRILNGNGKSSIKTNGNAKPSLLENIRASGGIQHFNAFVDSLPYELLVKNIAEITEVRRCQSYNYCVNEIQERISNNFNSTAVYAQPLAGNHWLPVDQQIANAEYIYNYLLQEGWTPQAIYGILGNITNESYLNPDASQKTTGRTKGNGNGYGIIQWDPPENKFLRWLGTEGEKVEVNELAETSPETLMNLQLEYFIISSTRPITPKDGGELMYLEFYEGPKENSVNYLEYITLENTPSEMAVIFCDSYERSDHGNKERQEWAERWSDYFEEGYNIREYYREMGYYE